MMGDATCARALPQSRDVRFGMPKIPLLKSYASIKKTNKPIEIAQREAATSRKRVLTRLPADLRRKRQKPKYRRRPRLEREEFRAATP